MQLGTVRCACQFTAHARVTCQVSVQGEATSSGRPSDDGYSGVSSKGLRKAIDDSTVAMERVMESLDSNETSQTHAMMQAHISACMQWPFSQASLA